MSTPLKFLLWTFNAAPILAESSADSNLPSNGYCFLIILERK